MCVHRCRLRAAAAAQFTPPIGPTPEQAKEHPQLVFAMTPQHIDEAIAYGYRDKSPIAIYTVLAGLRGDKRQVAFASTPFADPTAEQSRRVPLTRSP